MVAGGGLMGLPVMTGLLAGIVLRDRVARGPLSPTAQQRGDAAAMGAPGAGVPTPTR
jgi:hypothetical protein